MSAQFILECGGGGAVWQRGGDLVPGVGGGPVHRGTGCVAGGAPGRPGTGTLPGGGSVCAEWTEWTEPWDESAGANLPIKFYVTKTTH